MRPTLLPLALLALAPAGTALADACETVKAAYDRLAAAPAVAQTVTMAGMPAMRMVTIGDTLYMDPGQGTWTTVPLQPGMRAEMMAETVPDASALTGCREVGSETLDGAAMTVIEYTPPAIDGTAMAPQTVWIGADDGLPHRMTAVQDGEPFEMRIGYEGVTAPVE